jgi:HPr kinase/phosphorylase
VGDTQADDLGDRILPLGERRWHCHASAFALDQKGVLILGAAGSGKSSLALQLMAFGAQLVSDDMVWIEAEGGSLFACRPDSSPDLIEARGLGVLNAGAVCPRASIALVIDLDRTEPARLPPRRMVTLGAATAPLILGAGQPSLGYGLLQMLRHGRATP